MLTVEEQMAIHARLDQVIMAMEEDHGDGGEPWAASDLTEAVLWEVAPAGWPAEKVAEAIAFVEALL